MYELRTTLWLPRKVDEVFPFFADAANLQRITPPFLSFRILTPLPIEMRTGTLIDYRISLRGIPMTWRTRISVWEPNRRFIDEQLKGPYRTWIHEHTFEPADGGTLCKDVVTYDAPGGAFIHRTLVRPDLEKIFAFRQKELARIFGGDTAATHEVVFSGAA